MRQVSAYSLDYLMRAKVAVATVQGKPYYRIVNELKQRNIAFISLIPGQPIRAEIQAVVTTTQEKSLVNHPNVLVFEPETEPAILGTEVQRILHGKKVYNQVIVGLDPGEIIGVTVLGDDEAIDMQNCYSVAETVSKVMAILGTVDLAKTEIAVKIGNGVPIYREIAESLDSLLPPEVRLEIVSEAGTNRGQREVKNRRIFRHTFSAMRIARRTGHIYPRRKMVE
jgi:hypothetical protein